MHERDLLYRAALLAGHGAGAGALAATLTTRGAVDGARTCIDGGSDLLLAVHAPGVRGLRIWRRGADAGAAQRWQAWCGAQRQAQIAVYSDDGGRAAALALAGGRADHALLAANGHVYRIERHVAATWVAYRLDRQTQPAPLLAALDGAAAWATTDEIWTRLLGRPLPARSRPWSIALTTGRADARLRIGSTLWALLPEQAAKHQRLAALVDSLGGDGRYAEGLYKLLASNDRTAIVGAAVELTLTPAGDLLAADFVLRARPAPHSMRDDEETMPEDHSYLNKIDPQTANYLVALPEDANPVVAVAVEWAHTPDDSDLVLIDDLGGVWQGGDTPALVPSLIQTLRLPLRAVPALARLACVATVTAAVPLGYGEDDPVADDDMPAPNLSLGF